MGTNFGEQTLESMNQANWYNQWTLEKFKKYLRGRILEVGCGIGNFTKPLLSFGEVYGIDVKKEYIDKTKSFLNKQNVHIGFGNIETGKYFFDKERFDSIVCINVLEHIKNDDNSIKNMYKLLKNNGFLVLLVPAHPFLYGEVDKSIGHFRRYSKQEIVQKLENQGFKILRFQSLNLFGALGWFISGRVLKNTIVSKSKIKLFNLLAPFFLRLEDLIKPQFGTSFLIISQK